MSLSLQTRRAALALILLCLPAPQAVEAQSVDCQGLRARIDAASDGGARAGQYASALRQQQYELRRTQAYSESIGCSSNFLFNSGPAQCEAISARIEQMQQNIGQLQEQLQSGGDDADRRRALTEQYNAYCTGRPPDPTLDDPSQGREMGPVDPDAPPAGEEAVPETTARPHRVRALCVRECDGGFFPITDDASSGSIEAFDHLCKALCPNTKASLYTAAPSAGIETSVAVDGTPYTSLPAAFRFQKTFDATCSCKPPHQSWVEALAQAEKMIGTTHGDVTVTQTMSDAMSRPARPAEAGKNAPPAKASLKTKTARKAKTPVTPLEPDLADQGLPMPPDALGGDVTQQLRRDAPTL